MRNFVYSLFLLQSDLSYMWKSQDSGNSNTIAIIVVVAIVAVIILVVYFTNKKGGGGGGSRSSGKLFSGLSFHRMVRNVGLNHEQIKMLDFVFKTDDVVEPEKSIVNPTLLDRHFRRAYRVIEQSSGSEQEAQRKFAILFSTRNILENSSVGLISSTRQLKEDSVLTVTHGKDKININVISAKNDQLITDVPKSVLGSQIKIPKGTKLNVMFFTKSNKAFAFETRVIGYTTAHSQPAMQLAHSNQLRFLSLRRFRRKSATIACFMYLVYVEGSGKKQRLIVDKRRLSGNIMDISVGGCSIKTTSPVQVGARFKIEFTQGEFNVAALGQVLRTNRTGLNTIIHIKFLRVTQKSMNLINAFVYEYAHE